MLEITENYIQRMSSDSALFERVLYKVAKLYDTCYTLKNYVETNEELILLEELSE